MKEQEEQDNSKGSKHISGVGKAAPASIEKLIFLVDNHARFIDELRMQLEYYGYQAEAFTDLASFEMALLQRQPSAILMDIGVTDKDITGVDVIKRGVETGKINCPVFYASADDDFASRMLAVKGYAKAYLSKPIDISYLIDHFEAFIPNATNDPLRVLIVEQSSTLIKRYDKLLTNVGMSVIYEKDIEQALEQCLSFYPDMILIDLEQGEHSGLEVAKLIRQHQSMEFVSILLIGDEPDRELEYLRPDIRADGIILKNMSDEHVVHIVRERARRAKYMKSLIERDSLTGLLVHTKIVEHLTVQIELCNRLQRKLCYALIDIDHFKHINEIHGHLAGDNVLRYFAENMRKCLRASDILCRYGGEEFAVILLDADINQAAMVMERLKNSLENFVFSSDDSIFTVTFSAGIANFPEYGSAYSLMQAADEALSDAKAKGRNKIIARDAKAKSSR